jgi:hypothetical protein
MVGPPQQRDGEWSAEITKLHVPSREMELCKCSMRRRRVSRLLDLRAVCGSASGIPARSKNCGAIINEWAEESKRKKKKTGVRSQESEVTRRE